MSAAPQMPPLVNGQSVWFEIPVTDLDRRIYATQLRDFLPDRIIDVHTHAWLKKPRPRPGPGTVSRTVNWPGKVAAANPIEDLLERPGLSEFERHRHELQQDHEDHEHRKRNHMRVGEAVGVMGRLRRGHDS